MSHFPYGDIDLTVSSSLTSTFFYMIYICCVDKILLDIKPRKMLLMLNSYKYNYKLTDCRNCKVECVPFINQYIILINVGLWTQVENNGVDVNATSTRRVQTTPVK